MKKWVLRFRAKDKIIFDQIVSGEKTVETRANTSRYSPMKTGDFLVLICGKEKQEKRIKSVRRYKSIDEMAKVIEIQKVIPNISSVEEAKKIYFSFPKYKEKIEKFGILAFEI